MCEKGGGEKNVMRCIVLRSFLFRLCPNSNNDVVMGLRSGEEISGDSYSGRGREGGGGGGGEGRMRKAALYLERFSLFDC